MLFFLGGRLCSFFELVFFSLSSFLERVFFLGYSILSWSWCSFLAYVLSWSLIFSWSLGSFFRVYMFNQCWIRECWSWHMGVEFRPHCKSYVNIVVSPIYDISIIIKKSQCNTFIFIRRAEIDAQDKSIISSAFLCSMHLNQIHRTQR